VVLALSLLGALAASVAPVHGSRASTRAHSVTRATSALVHARIAARPVSGGAAIARRGDARPDSGDALGLLPIVAAIGPASSWLVSFDRRPASAAPSRVALRPTARGPPQACSRRRRDRGAALERGRLGR
jgi:hypothetical protein